MDLSRRSGVLLHPTSLPGPYGRGDLGPEAFAFVDWLQAAGQRTWQVLPLGPPGYGGSPYAALSAFAGDALLISPERLLEEGLLTRVDLADAPAAPAGRVSEECERWRRGVIARAAERFLAEAGATERAELAAFRAANAYWLEDYALYTALKEAHQGAAYWEGWPDGLRRHLPRALGPAREAHAAAVAREEVLQLLLARQWGRLREHARARGVELIGDIPIFVARDSADVWSRPELFLLDGAGEPTVVAGVPPDLFSEDGQRWGNPLYDWRIHARTAYAWWIERIGNELGRSDLLRIDHFRGFASYWEVPAHAPTAREGTWVTGPREELFAAVREALGEVPVVAEDLGYITPDVTELLAATRFPGMRILQFAFYEDDPAHPFLPENHPVESVVYTGTHDNQTTAGWWAGLEGPVRARVARRVDPGDPVWGLIDLALGSAAFLAVIPAQDLLELDDGARMNSPGTERGNWTWRLERPLETRLAERLRARALAHRRTGA